MSLPCPAVLLLALPLISLASAQGVVPAFEPVLRENDLVAGESIISIESAVIGDDGTWHAIVLRNFPSHDRNASLLRNGNVLGFEPAFLPLPGGERVYYFETLASGGSYPAMLAHLTRQASTTGAMAVLRRGHVVLLQGDPVLATGLPPDTQCLAIETLAGNEQDELLVVARIEGAPGERALLRYEFRRDGITRASTLLLRTGDTLSDGSVVRNLPVELRSLALNERGQWLARVLSTDGGERLVGENGVVLRTGDPSPLPGRPIVEIGPNFDLNDFGVHALSVRVAGAAGTEVLLLKDGEVLAAEGDVVPSVLPFFPGLVLADIGRVRLANSGNVYWQLMIGEGPLARGFGGFMRDSQLILEVGNSFAGGRRILAFSDDPENFQISPSGRFWLGRVELAGTGEALVLADFGAAVPLPGCTANAATLRLSQGLVRAGATPHVALDGAVPLGSTGIVHVSLGAARPGEDCGIATPHGEVMIDPAQLIASVPAGLFAGGALDVPMAIPANLALVNMELFLQGSFTRPGGGIVLSNGMRLEIGAP